MKEQTSLESIATGGCTFLFGYVLLVIALLADRPVLLYVGAGIFLIGFVLVRKFDDEVKKGCAISGLPQLLWIGFVAAFVLWDVDLVFRVILFLFSPPMAI